MYVKYLIYNLDFVSFPMIFNKTKIVFIIYRVVEQPRPSHGLNEHLS